METVQNLYGNLQTATQQPMMNPTLPPGYAYAFTYSSGIMPGGFQYGTPAIYPVSKTLVKYYKLDINIRYQFYWYYTLFNKIRAYISSKRKKISSSACMISKLKFFCQPFVIDLKVMSSTQKSLSRKNLTAFEN